MSALEGNLLPRDEERIELIAQQGIKPARLLVLAARITDLPVYVGCAVVEKETGDGGNKWGGDPGAPFENHHNLKVTPDAYREYKIERGPEGKGNGVGPCQLTHWSIQNDADELGGTYIPFINMLTGFDFITELHENNDNDWEAVWPRWNQNPTYVRDMIDERMPRWNEVLNLGLR